MNNKKDEQDFFREKPLESIDSIVNEETWNDEDIVMKNGKKNILRFIIIKLLTILIISYIIVAYKFDLEYYFQDKGVKDIGKVTIETLKKIDMNELKKYDNSVVSLSGWVEIENSFTMKLNFKKYNVLKLWRKPIFVLVTPSHPSFIPPEGTSSDIPFLKPVKGRLIIYGSMSEGFLLNSYSGIITAYQRAKRKACMMDLECRKSIKEMDFTFPKNGVIVVADYLPGKDLKVLIIPILLLLYVLYSLFALIKIFKVVKKGENSQR